MAWKRLFQRLQSLRHPKIALQDTIVRRVQIRPVELVLARQVTTVLLEQLLLFHVLKDSIVQIQVIPVL